MSKRILSLIASAAVLIGSARSVFADGNAVPQKPVNVAVPAAATTYSSISIIWDKPEDYKEITGYNVYIDGELADTTAANETYYTAEGLEPDTEYEFTVTSLINDTESEASDAVVGKTDVKGTVRDVTAEPYKAVGDGTTLNTAAIQQAIDDCEENDIVLIPEGTFLTGALDLKSNMTLEVNGELLGSSDAADFEKAVPAAKDIEFTKPVIGDDGASITAANNTAESRAAVLIVSSYENGTLKDVSVSAETTIAANEAATLTAAAPVTDDYKIMVWDSLDSMKPLYDANETVRTYSGGTTAAGAVYNAEAQKRLIWSRIEGIEQYSYRSLINVGYLDEDTDYSADENYVCSNVKIIGTGTISGGNGKTNISAINGNGSYLAKSECESAGTFYEDADNNIMSRIRGRLINVSNARDIYIKGVTVKNPPMWTVHMIYSDNITTNGVTFSTSGYRNGDGWDPDSSTDCTIFDCDFDTGDDCVAIKSGKNPEGNAINRPAKNIKVLGCRSDGGLGLAVGSEMSGGVEGVYVRDCEIIGTRYGVELKANAVRGGYIRDFHVQDSTIDQVLIHSVTYNADGDPADTPPVFSDMSFKNTVIRGYSSESSSKPWLSTSITMEGFTVDSGADNYYIRNIAFEDITVGTAENNPTQNISMKYCRDITFDNVLQTDNWTPNYSSTEATYKARINGVDIDDIVPEFADTIEAERMHLDGFETESNSYASSGAVIKLPGSGSGREATAKAKYTGESGTMDIGVTYFDENDGTETYTLYVGESEEAAATWTTTTNLGSAGADEQTLVNHIAENVTINSGDEIRLVVTAKSQYAAGRVDYIEVGGHGTIEQIAPPELDEGITGSISGNIYTWAIGQSNETDTTYSDTNNDIADLTVSLGSGDSMYRKIVFSGTSVKEPDTNGYATVNDTQRYLLVEPKVSGAMSVTITFSGSQSNNRIYYKDFEDGDVDLTQCSKGGNGQNGTTDDRMGSKDMGTSTTTVTLDMTAGHKYVLYTYQNASEISALSYQYTE